LIDLNEFVRKRSDLRERYERARGTPSVWNVIRDGYEFYLPSILEAAERGGCISPYFFDWKFTPIEMYAWQDIRGTGIPMYPQVPVGRYFIDFADPFLKIGVELDGKDFHDRAKDEARDEDLWSQGWRIFRIPGRESLPGGPSPMEKRSEYPSDLDYREALIQWGLRWSEGFFWALKKFYYSRRNPGDLELVAAECILDGHRFIEFPLSTEESE